MEFLLEHWLSVATTVFLIAMILHGHYRGFLRIALSMTALVLTLVIVRLAMPYVTGYLKQSAVFHQAVEKVVSGMLGDEVQSYLGEAAVLPAGQRIIIEQLHLPEQMKEALLENNNNEVYRMLGVDTFIDYISAYIANMILTVIGSILLFLIVYIALRLIIRWLDLIAKIPILAGINQIAGAVLGGMQGLVLLWFLCLIVSLCSQQDWAASILQQINQSSWLSLIYHNNIFNWLLRGILNGLLK